MPPHRECVHTHTHTHTHRAGGAEATGAPGFFFESSMLKPTNNKYRGPEMYQASSWASSCLGVSNPLVHKVCDYTGRVSASAQDVLLLQEIQDVFLAYACSVASVLFSHALTLGDPMDYTSPASSIRGIFPARILEWVAMPSSSESSQPRNQTRISYLSCIAGRSFIAEPPGKPKISLFCTFL